MKKQVVSTVAILLAAFALVACHDKKDGAVATTSSSSSGASTPPPPGASGAVATHEFYQGSLFALAPSSPGSAFSVDASANVTNTSPAIPLLDATCHEGQFLGAHVRTVFYARNDGTLQQVSTSTDATPSPTRVSSEANALPICNNRVAQDFAKHDNTRIAYELAGSDCTAQSTWRVVTLSDDATTAPRNFPGRPVAALFNTVDFSHAGWLTVQNGELKRVGADNNVQATLTTVTNFADPKANLANGKLLIIRAFPKSSG